MKGRLDTLLEAMNRARTKEKTVLFWWPEWGAKRLRVVVQVDQNGEVIYWTETDQRTGERERISVYDLLIKMESFEEVKWLRGGPQ